MQQTTNTSSGNQKLRDLLKLSKELLAKRQLKKALNNAQIAKDFAVRSGEAPEIAAEAQLLMAEIYLLNSVYTFDQGLRKQGWRLIEQLESDGLTNNNQCVCDLKVAFVKATSMRRLGELDTAKSYFTELLEKLDEEHGLYLPTVVGLCYTLSKMEGEAIQPVLAKAEKALEKFPPEEKIDWASTLYLAKAHEAFRNNELGKALDSAHRAKELSRKSGNPETEALSKLLMGKLSHLRDNYHISLRLLYDAMDSAELIDCTNINIEAQLQIGKVFQSLNNSREADKYFTSVAQQSATFNIVDSRYASAIALGQSALRAKDFDLANRRFAEALEAAKDIALPEKRGIAYGELATLKLEENQTGLAQHLVEESKNCLAKGVHQKAYAKTYLTSARLAALAGNEELAMQEGEKAAAYAKTDGDLETAVTALRLLSDLYQKQDAFENAYGYQKEASELAVKLFDQQRDRHLPDLDMRSALLKKEREIEELTKQNSLKNDLLAKTEEVEKANQDLVQAYEELRQFAYVASHDLKEPLRQIGSYVSLIQRNYAHLLDERGVGFFGYVTDGVSRLNKLFDSLMKYTSVARADNSSSDVDLNKLVSSVESELSAKVNLEAGTFNYADLPVIRSSASLLRQVICALMDNAVKFVDADTKPSVLIEVRSLNKEYTFVIKDNGIGINEEYQNKVFVLFQMLHAKTEYSGTGVGLAIAQATIQRLGGRIWFEKNADGPGTTFYFTIPESKAEKTLAEAA